MVSFDVFVDESGDQGFGPASSKWFVLAAVVALRHHAEALHAMVKSIKTTIHWRKGRPLHFKDIKQEWRPQVFGQLISDTKLFRAMVVLVYKPLLTQPEAFAEGNRLYFYFTRYLLERVSWLCRDSREHHEKRHGDGTARVVFSCMNEISRAKMEAYFRHLQSMDTQIDWSTLIPGQFETLRSGEHAGLQIVDCIAGAFYCSGHECGKRRTDEWARVLKPMMYRNSKGRYRGYGVKFCPPELEKANAQGQLAPWALDYSSL